MLNKPFKNLLFALILIFCVGLGQAQETERVRVYRVQFAASKTFIQPTYFQKKFNLEDSIRYFEKDDYYKYYIGDFDTRVEAEDYYHKTNDAGYVISMMIDKAIVPEQDTMQQQVEPDTIVVTTEDTLKLDTARPSNQNKVLEEPVIQNNKIKLTNFQKLIISCGFFLLVLIIVMIIWSRIRSKRKAALELADMEFLEYDEEELVDQKELIVDEGLIEIDEPVLVDVEEKELVNPFAVLDDPANNLSGWDQLRMLKMIKDGKVDPPDFSFWLDSDNSTIVAFCLRMIRSLKPENAYKAVSRLLHHKKDDIRAEAIVTLGMLGNKDTLSLFRKRFDQETYTNRMLILRSMTRIPDDSSIEFLKDLLTVYGNLQIEAANALASIESVGIEGVEKILEENAISSETIARHILINKL